ncbi:MAG: PrsW family intramembrane metalloprotease [Candidatus Marinimicrobia bacterium]|nr:PrsW family intramembrane metalloprotease [Candidatus Neomarinimicrobiota bacterium]
MFMNLIRIVLLSVLPGLLWIGLIYRTDRYEPEPKRMIVKAFILGMFAVFPAILIENALYPGSDVLSVIVVAPLIEELLKFLIFMIFFYHHREFDEPLDGIIYACSIALGFATIENVFYVFSAIENNTVYAVAGLRALLSLPGHFLFSALWGYAAGVVKFGLRPGVTLGAGFAAAVLLHAGFNFTATISAFGISVFIFILSLYAWIVFSRHLRELQADSRYRNTDDTQRKTDRKAR